MKHRFVRRVSALALAGCLLAGSSLPAFAAASAAKEEVIYANLTASGAVTGVYAVNSFSVQAGDTVADHGSYTAVRNMTTSDAVEQSGDTVTVHVTEDGKLYYEGTMDAATALPWVVKLTYTLDGAEISPDELGGKSGALSIRLQVSRNPDCTGSFFDDYALQVTMSLDTGLARNIEAPGATVANVGSKKQLSYILLPGADSNVTVTADVTDFAMDAVSLNGVRLNLNLDLGNMDLTGMLEQLQSGSVQLDDGANALADGIAQVQAGIDTLNGNSGALTGGSARVRAALTQMQTALNGISASTDELNTLLDASTQIRDGIARLDEGAAQLEQQVSFEAYKAILRENGLDLDVVKEGNAKAIQQLQGVQGLLGGLLHGGGLGEEIHAHVDAGGPGPAVIAVEGPVRVQGALLAVAPQTQAQIGKVDALPLQRRPVDGALVVRHVHAPAGGVFRAQIADADAVAAVVVGIPAEVLLRQAAGGDTLMGRHPYHVKSVVDIYLPRVGIGLRLLPGAAAPQGQNDRRQQSANHQHRRDQQQHRQQTPPRPAAGRGNSIHSYLSFSKTCMSKAMRQSSCVSLHNFSTPAFGVFQQ